MSFQDPELESGRLVAILETYLAALESRDFSAVRLAVNVRHVENTCDIPVGTGFARSVKSFWAKRHYFTDVSRGSVVFWGVAEENSRQTLVAIRLRIEGNVIAEIETLCSRGSGEYFQPEALVSGQEQLQAILPIAERSSRESMIEICHRYFDGIERSDGSIVPVTSTCLRLVNGGVDANADTQDMGEEHAYRGFSVQKQITDGYYAYIEALRGRRVVVVDEERGLLVIHLLFDHPADPRQPYSAAYFPDPSTVLASEVFKIRNGLIEMVSAIGALFPYGARSGWGDGDMRVIQMDF